MKHLLNHMRWDALLMHRNRLFIIALVIGVFYTGLFYLLKPLGNLSFMLVLLIINDPVVTGVVFAGVLWIFDKQQHTMEALVVGPFPFRNYFLSKCILLSILGSLTALGMALAMLGFDFKIGHLLLSVFLSTFMFACFGFMIAALAKSLNRFLIYLIPFLVVCALPIAFLMSEDQQLWTWLFPSKGMVEMLRYSLTESGDVPVSTAYLHLLIWTVISWYLMLSISSKRIS